MILGAKCNIGMLLTKDEFNYYSAADVALKSPINELLLVGYIETELNIKFNDFFYLKTKPIYDVYEKAPGLPQRY